MCQFFSFSRKISIGLLTCLSVLLLLSACKAAPPTPTPLTDAEIATVKDLFLVAGCAACHQFDQTNAIGGLGPDLTHIGTVAATRREGVSAVEYIRTSITAPNDFISPDCPGGPCASPSYMTTDLNAKLGNNLELMVRYLAEQK